MHHFKSAAHLAGLWALAVAQPVFELLTRSPEFFVAHRADVLDVMLLAGIVAFLPPLALGLLIVVGAALGRRVGDAIAAAIAGALIATIAVQLGYRAGITSWSQALAAGPLVMALTAIAWLRLRAVRSFLTVLSPAVVIVPMLLLFSSGVRSATWHSSVSVDATVTGSTPVVLVVFDELPLASLLDAQGQLDPVRYPNFAALAHDGIWFRRATAISDYTRWAVPAILTGRNPVSSQTPTARDHPNSLFTLLSPHYGVKAEEPITAICPRKICGSGGSGRRTRVTAMLKDIRVVAAYVLLPPNARSGLPDLTQGWAGFTSGSIDGGADDADDAASSAGGLPDPRSPDLGPGVGHLDSGRALIASISASSESPTLYFLHTLLSHHPPRWLPTGQLIRGRQSARSRDRKGRWVVDPWPVIHEYQGHLLQVALADALVGELRDRLVKTGLYDRALIMVTADHGASFRPGDLMRDVTDTNAAEILSVPLVVKLPRDDRRGAANRVDDRPARTIDVLPTITDVLGVKIPWAVDGASLVDSRANDVVGASHRPEARGFRIYVEDATRTREFTAEQIAAGLAHAVEWKLSLFGTDVWPATRVPGTERLLGHPLSSVEIESDTSGLHPRLARPLALEDVDPLARVLPAQVIGRIEPAARAAQQPVVLAIAVNERIVATTQTLPRESRWMALVPPSALHRGANHLDVFLVDPQHPDKLRRPSAPAGSDPENLALGGAAVVGVDQSGFHRAEVRDGVPFRWTSGNASIKVPIDPAHPPSELELRVLASGPAGKALHVTVDRCNALDARLPQGRWEKRIPLGRCTPQGYWADIAITSDVHTPSERDRRRLGVAIERVTLR